MTSILSFIKYLADAETTLSTITFWLMGSFENTTMNDVYILLPIVLICSIIIILIRYRINVVALGIEEAQTKGINYRFYRMLTLFYKLIMFLQETRSIFIVTNRALSSWKEMNVDSHLLETL